MYEKLLMKEVFSRSPSLLYGWASIKGDYFLKERIPNHCIENQIIDPEMGGGYWERRQEDLPFERIQGLLGILRAIELLSLSSFQEDKEKKACLAGRALKIYFFLYPFLKGKEDYQWIFDSYEKRVSEGKDFIEEKGDSVDESCFYRILGVYGTHDFLFKEEERMKFLEFSSNQGDEKSKRILDQIEKTSSSLPTFQNILSFFY